MDELSFKTETTRCARSKQQHDTATIEAIKTEPDTELREELTQTCRLCAQSGTSNIPIFSESNLAVAEKISRCLPVIILSTDKLPLHICKKCFYCLNISYKLIVSSINADALLRARLVESSEMDDGICDSNELSQDQEMTVKVESIEDLEKRGREISTNGPVECDLCNENFHDMKDFDDHMETSHLQKWRCDLCDRSFKKSKSLVSHKNSLHDGQITSCGQCEESTTTAVSESPLARIKKPAKLPLIRPMPSTGPPIMIPLPVYTPRTGPVPVAQQPIHTGLVIDPVCEICKVTVDDDEWLEKHKRVHLPREIPCGTCHANCTSVYDLFWHKRQVHSMYNSFQLKFVCEKCGRFFSNGSQWETHDEMTCPKKFSIHSCKYCDVTFSTKHKLMRHLRKHKQEMLDDPDVIVYKCIACPKIFVDKEFYEKHRNVHDPECWDKFKCTLCNRPFRDRVRLREHQQSIHEGVKPHQCDVCGRTFHRMSNMRVHRAKHFGHKCSHCDEVFERLRPLADHLREVHGLTPDIRMQPRKHHEGNGFVCKFCGKKLSTLKSGIDHEHIHTGERPYSCHICDKSFRSYTSRWAHVQRHEKGNFVCEHCGKCFNYKQNLKTHMQIHVPMEDRKHSCPQCSKRFLRKAHLDVHMRIHDGLRPYTCDICLFSFTQIGDMRRHRARHANGELRTRQPRKSLMPVSSNEESA